MRGLKGWMPDTCGCVLYFWQDPDDPAHPFQQFDRVEPACERHAGLPWEAIWERVNAESALRKGVLVTIADATGADPDETQTAFDEAERLLVVVPASLVRNARAAVALAGYADRVQIAPQ